MIRTFLEYQLQRALDYSPTLPLWLRVMLRYDPHLRQFANDSRQLDHLLRAGAIAERESLFPETFPASQTQRNELATRTCPSRSPDRALLGWLSAAALAATIAIAVFSLRTTDRRANAERARFLSQQLTAVPEEMASILSFAVYRSQAELPRYNPLAQLRLPETNLFADITNQTQTSLNNQVDSLVSPWQSLGAEFFSEWTNSGEPGT